MKKDSGNVFHSIRVKLHPSNLPGEKQRYYARTASEAVLSVEQVCAQLKRRGGFTGNYADLVTHVKQFFDEAAYQLCDGFAVQTDYFSVHPVVGGYFDGAVGDISFKGHPVGFRFLESPRLRRIADAITIEVINSRSGYIEQFLDCKSDTVNLKLTAGSLCVLNGSRIKIGGESPECGLYFVSAAKNVREPLRVKAAMAPLTNTSRRVISCVPPDLPDGEYFVEIRTQCPSAGGGTYLKKPRAVTSTFTLTAAREEAGT
ncbi:MAG: DUF4469 domain-containing protein [Treponema sp.]|nr:DUF4469 domain-containing protein [Treponema sp.]